VSGSLIRMLKRGTDLPLIVGGGIDNRRKAAAAIKAGADMIVIGNGFEKNVYLLNVISSLF
jgi:heptaprenylglyceryl phosphate synthase